MYQTGIERRSPVGADDESRTRDLDYGKVVFYQLNYIRENCNAGDQCACYLTHQALCLMANTAVVPHVGTPAASAFTTFPNC